MSEKLSKRYLSLMAISRRPIDEEFKLMNYVEPDVRVIEEIMPEDNGNRARIRLAEMEEPVIPLTAENVAKYSIYYRRVAFRVTDEDDGKFALDRIVAADIYFYRNQGMRMVQFCDERFRVDMEVVGRRGGENYDKIESVNTQVAELRRKIKKGRDMVNMDYDTITAEGVEYSILDEMDDLLDEAHQMINDDSFVLGQVIGEIANGVSVVDAVFRKNGRLNLAIEF